MKNTWVFISENNIHYRVLGEWLGVDKLQHTLNTGIAIAVYIEDKGIWRWSLLNGIYTGIENNFEKVQDAVEEFLGYCERDGNDLNVGNYSKINRSYLKLDK